MSISEPSSTHRFDPAYALPFLTAATASFLELGWISELEADQFRLSLRDLAKIRNEEKLPESIVSELHKDPSSVVSIFLATQGEAAFHYAFMRWTLSHALEEILFTLRELTQCLLKKSELLFHQRFFYFQNDRCEKQSFFSFFLIDQAQDLFEISTKMESIISEFKVFLSPGPWNGDKTAHFSKTFAQHIGFRYLEIDTPTDHRFADVFDAATHLLETLGFTFKRLAEQLSHNLDANTLIEKMELIHEDWSSLTEQLRTLPTRGNGSLEKLEHRRNSATHVIHSFKGLLEQQLTLVSEALKTIYLCKQSTILLPESDCREIVGLLLAKGIRLLEAQNAIEKLKSYCRTHKVHPSELLDSELQRIHSSFDQDLALALKTFSLDRFSTSRFSEEKQSVVRQKDKILHHLNLHLSPLILILLILTNSLVACGIKTAPRSDVLDLRPAVPYHAGQLSHPQAETLKAAPPPEK